MSELEFWAEQLHVAWRDHERMRGNHTIPAWENAGDYLQAAYRSVARRALELSKEAWERSRFDCLSR